MTLTRIVLCIEYNGYGYAGWQRQENVPSIQNSLEQAVAKIAGEEVCVFCAGRTDAGVHATGQIVHFDVRVKRKLSAWVMGINSYLPKDIVIKWAKEINQQFHARFSAIARRYRYIIYNFHYRSALLPHVVTHYYFPLDTDKMSRAGQAIVGSHDFTSYRSSQCQSHTPWRNLIHLYVWRQGNYVVIDIKANSFLHRMVRNIVGNLISIGSGKRSEDWMAKLLEMRDRTKGLATAGAEGLCLIAVDYPAYFALPKTIIDSFL